MIGIMLSCLQCSKSITLFYSILALLALSKNTGKIIFDSKQYFHKEFLMLYIFHNIVIKYNSSFLLTAREYKECGDTIKGLCIQNDLLRSHREFIWFQLNFRSEGNLKPLLSLKSLWQFSGTR